jgi:hypothetical protein
LAKAPQLRIKKWDEYQHYKERRPPWVKFHTSLLDNYELMALRASSKFLACGLLLLAARCDNVIPNDSLRIAKQLEMNTQQVTTGIEDLLRIGFVEPIRRTRGASKVRAGRYAQAETDSSSEKTAKPTEAGKRSKQEPVDLKIVEQDGFHAERLLETIGDHADERTPGQIRSFIGRVAPSVFERIREQLSEGRAGNRAKYAHAELKREAAA